MFSPYCPARCSFYGTLWAIIEALTDSDLPVQGAKPHCTPSLHATAAGGRWGRSHRRQRGGPPAACGQGAE